MSPVPEGECFNCGQHRDSRDVRTGASYCATVDYFGEVDCEWPRHRWASWSDAELRRAGISPERWDDLRRADHGEFSTAVRESVCEREGHVPETEPSMAGLCRRCFKEIPAPVPVSGGEGE